MVSFMQQGPGLRVQNATYSYVYFGHQNMSIYDTNFKVQGMYILIKYNLVLKMC